MLTLHPIDRGDIARIGFEPIDKLLLLERTDGEFWVYYGAEPSIIDRFRHARCVDTFFAEHVRDRLGCQRVGTWAELTCALERRARERRSSARTSATCKNARIKVAPHPKAVAF